MRGEVNRAFEWLDRAYEQRDGGDEDPPRPTLPSRRSAMGCVREEDGTQNLSPIAETAGNDFRWLPKARGPGHSGRLRQVFQSMSRPGNATVLKGHRSVSQPLTAANSLSSSPLSSWLCLAHKKATAS